MAPVLTPEQIIAFHEQGFVIVRGAFELDRILRLRAAIEGLCALAAEEEDAAGGSGEPDFPPWQWLDREQRLPARMGDYLHPKKYHPEFGAWVTEDAIPQLEQLCSGRVRHNRFQMLASGGGQPYLQHWHRDWGNTKTIIGVESPTATEYADACRGANGKHVEWNTPLLPDEHFLQVVPGSHCRACTEEELAHIGAGFVTEEEVANGGEFTGMPGGVTVRMELGDVCYFDAGIIHRGWNPTGINRWTMHNVSWRADIPIMWDYEPVGGSTVPDLEALVKHGSLPTAFEDYVLNFTEAVRKTQSDGSRESSFCDLWMSQNDADKRRNWAATEAARDAVGAAAAARL